MRKKSRPFKLHSAFLFIGVFWTILIGFIVLHDMNNHRQDINSLIKSTAMAAFEKDVAFREWAASHGGVYVPVDSITYANPNLSHVKERDIQSPNGQDLTLMNPAYMVRQLNEYIFQKDGVIGHLTSLKPLRVENKPDDWEIDALKKFEKGYTEYSEFSTIGGKEYYRFMKPFTAQKSCLKCHGHQGYQIGDIIGGIGIAFPTESFVSQNKTELVEDALIYSFLWLLGMIGLFLSMRIIKARLEKEHEVEKRLLMHAEQTPLGVIEWDLDFRVASWNESAERIFGYTDEEAIGKHAKFIVPKSIWNDIDTIWEGLKNNIGGGRSTNENIHKTGELIHCEWYNTPLVDKSSNVISVTSLVQDITERIRVKHKLFDSERKYRQLFENMTAGFALHEMIYDRKGKPVDYRFLEINPAFEKLTGAKAADLMGKTVLETMPNTEQYWIDTYGKVASTGESVAYENYAEELQKHFEAWAFCPEKGYFAVAFTDVTDRKNAEKELEEYKDQLEILVKERTEELESTNEELRTVNEELFDNNKELEYLNDSLQLHQNEIAELNQELKDSNEELNSTNESLFKQKTELEKALNELQQAQIQLIQAEKMASLGILTAGVAHEINNPVNFITSSMYGLEMYSAKVDKVLSAYELIKNNNFQEQIEIIKKLKKDLKFDHTIESLQTIIKNINEGTNRIVNITSSLRTFSIKNDEPVLVENLHENVDATLTILYHETKNRIEIKKDYCDLPAVNCYQGKLNQVFMNILINAIQAIEGKGTIKIVTKDLKDQSQIKISFIDSGKGIPESVRDKIFEPFYSTKKEGQGTGLGLYISYGIIQQHGGNIEFKSKIGRGTEFSIFLPY